VREFKARGYRTLACRRLRPEAGHVRLEALRAVQPQDGGDVAGIAGSQERLLISPEHGPRLSLATVLTDAPIEPDRPFEVSGCGAARSAATTAPPGRSRVRSVSEQPHRRTGCATASAAGTRRPAGHAGQTNCGLCITVCPMAAGREAFEQEREQCEGVWHDQEVQVIFQPSGRRGEIERANPARGGQALGVTSRALRNKKVCGKCKVRIEEGYFEKDNIESGWRTSRR